MISAKIILDSISEVGARLTTMEVVMPRIILAEFNTHRMFSRNSASSRAVSVKKKIEEARNNPFIPVVWTQNERGMQGKPVVEVPLIQGGEETWLQACESACIMATALDNYGFHKQICNRLLEPFLWHTVLVTATEWENFFEQRCSSLAEPHMEILANAMRDAINKSFPNKLCLGDWHLPYAPVKTDVQVYSKKSLILISAARCARVSYQRHGEETNSFQDIQIGEKLLAASPPHWSPFEHQAQSTGAPNVYYANFKGWLQARHSFIIKD